MKKIYTLIVAAAFFGSLQAQDAQSACLDQVPVSLQNSNPIPFSITPWQVLMNYDITAAGGGTGNAGICLAPSATEFWVSKWASDTIRSYDLLGNITSTFTVPGVTGVRSMTNDGTSIYAGANTAQIFKINPVTKTLISTISVPTVPNVRYCTYDPTANSGAGGFWVGTWATDITQVSLTGAALGPVAYSSDHMLTAMYGMAFDNISPGGPYLWAFDQNPNPAANIVQLSVATGMQTGVIHDVAAEIGVAGSDIAGGLFFRAAPLSLAGILQGTANRLFAYDIAGVGAVSEVDNDNFINVLPNPATDMVNIKVARTNMDAMQIDVTDILGNTISSSKTVGINNYYNISAYKSGMYFVKVIYNGKIHTSKFIKQ